MDKAEIPSCTAVGFVGPGRGKECGQKSHSSGVKILAGPGVVPHRPLGLALGGQRQEDLLEFQDSLVCIVSFRRARTR